MADSAKNILSKMNKATEKREEEISEQVIGKDTVVVPKKPEENKLDKPRLFFCKYKGLKIVYDPSVILRSKLTGQLLSKTEGRKVKFREGRFAAETEEQLAVIEDFMSKHPGVIVPLSEQNKRLAELSKLAQDGDVSPEEMQELIRKKRKGKGKQGSVGSKVS